MRVFVYYNFHRGCWSVKALDGTARGRVVAHADKVTVRDAEFRVSEAGRQRVIREKKKNVHAGIVGTLDAWQGEATRAHPLRPYIIDGLWCREDNRYHKHGATQPRARYNPYECGHFVTDDGGKVERAPMVTLGKKRAVHFFDPCLIPC